MWIYVVGWNAGYHRVRFWDLFCFLCCDTPSTALVWLCIVFLYVSLHANDIQLNIVATDNKLNSITILSGTFISYCMHFKSIKPPSFLVLWTLTHFLAVEPDYKYIKYINLCLNIFIPLSGQSQMVNPSQPIVATVGQDIMLPCHLEPAVNVTDKTVEWTRPDLNPRFVYVWRDGVELEMKKHQSYVGRTSVSITKLKHGDISLKLCKVKISDKGKYRCFIPTLSRESTVELVVGEWINYCGFIGPNHSVTVSGNTFIYSRKVRPDLLKSSWLVAVKEWDSICF